MTDTEVIFGEQGGHDVSDTIHLSYRHGPIKEVVGELFPFFPYNHPYFLLFVHYFLPIRSGPDRWFNVIGSGLELSLIPYR